MALVLLLTLATCAFAQSTGAKRGISGAASALSDWADRQAAINAEIELEKAKADIEVEKQRRLQEMRADPSRQRAQDDQSQMMDKLHPQWKKIINSNIFSTWLDNQVPNYQEMCKRTKEALVLSGCIDTFFSTKLAKQQ